MGESNDKFFAIRGVVFQWTFLFLVASYICLPIYNPSFFADLMQGKWLLDKITANGWAIFSRELWAMGDGWTVGNDGAFHNGFYKFFLALVYNLGGYVGVIFFKIGLIFATLLTASYFSYRLCKHRFFAVFITLVGGMGGFYANEMTPLLFNMFLFTAVVSLVHKLIVLRKVKTVVALFVITILLVALDMTDYLLLYYGHPDEVANVTVAHKSIVSLYNYQFAFLLILSAVALSFCYMARFRQAKEEAVLIILCFLIAVFNSSFVCPVLFVISFACAHLWGKCGVEKLGDLANGIDLLGKKFDFIPTSGFAFLLCCISIVFIHRLMLMPIVVGK